MHCSGKLLPLRLSAAHIIANLMRIDSFHEHSRICDQGSRFKLLLQAVHCAHTRPLSILAETGVNREADPFIPPSFHRTLATASERLWSASSAWVERR